MRIIKILTVAVIVLAAHNVFATTWAETEVDDPIMECKRCGVQEPMSYGSYIYSWPSKYDLVFWPLTDNGGIWFCEDSGFTGFIGDFDEISEEEKKTIGEYLTKSYTGKKDIKSKLELLENIYKLRKKDDVFRNRLIRVLAYWYEDLGDIKKANEYRRIALEEIEGYLKKEMSEGQKLDYLYLAANYHRQLGDAKSSDKYLQLLRTAVDNLKDDKLKGHSAFLLELSEETKQIVPGGILRPEIK